MCSFHSNEGLENALLTEQSPLEKGDAATEEGILAAYEEGFLSFTRDAYWRWFRTNFSHPKLGMSETDFAVLVGEGVDRSTINRWLTGSKPITEKALPKIVIAFGQAQRHKPDFVFRSFRAPNLATLQVAGFLLALARAGGQNVGPLALLCLHEMSRSNRWRRAMSRRDPLALEQCAEEILVRARGRCRAWELGQLAPAAPGSPFVQELETADDLRQLYADCEGVWRRVVARLGDLVSLGSEEGAAAL